MKKHIGTWIVAALLVSAPAGSFAQGSFGIGIIVGEPTGVSAKIWLSQRSAIDLAAAWSSADETALHIHGDYVTHFFDLIDVSKGSLPLYAGVGGRVKFGENDDFIGVRIPVGLANANLGLHMHSFRRVHQGMPASKESPHPRRMAKPVLANKKPAA